jgi:enamine deaminase RidA (YjgF/YER057c/UK114 family)
MIRKVSSDGVGYSVVELNDHRHVFAAAIPRSGTTLREQTEDALLTIQAVMDEEGTRGAIVQQAVFVKDFDRLDECREIIRRFYGKKAMPATSYVAQPPCGQKDHAAQRLPAVGLLRPEDLQAAPERYQLLVALDGDH